jgi:DNA-binding NtrC family response regulator
VAASAPSGEGETVGRLGRDETAFVIIVERGHDATKRLRVDSATRAPVFVGTHPSCALQLVDPGVSPRHLSLESSAEGLYLCDLDSRSGTRVEGVRVLGVLLEGGERVEIGATTLRAELETELKPPSVPAETRFGRVFGASPEMRRLYPLLSRLARSTIPVVIEGETGTGKEAVAEALHEASPRADGPFMVFDCAAVAASLVESELFGHERGAFTGALASRRGVFEQAHGGTLLIDEIGDLDPALQPKLLRAIERSEVRPLGGSRAVQVDVRVLAATRRDLDREVREGRFRDDLFHRLAVARVELPPLRCRRDDIVVLARHFWSTLTHEGGPDSARTEPPRELLRQWAREDWPGNVRQLKNTIARTLALGSIGCTSLPQPPPAEGAGAEDDFIDEVVRLRLTLQKARERVVHEFERRYLEAALARHGGHSARAAKDSGIARRYFQLLRSRRT